MRVTPNGIKYLTSENINLEVNLLENIETIYLMFRNVLSNQNALLLQYQTHPCFHLKHHQYLQIISVAQHQDQKAMLQIKKITIRINLTRIAQW